MNMNAPARAPIDKLRPWHEQIADILLAVPGISQGEVARRLDKTQPWISQIMTSDLFKAYFAARVAEFRERQDVAIIQQTQKLALQGLGEMSERMEDETLRPLMPMKELRENTKMALDALLRPGAAGQVVAQMNMEVNIASEAITRARNKMQRINMENTQDAEEADTGVYLDGPGDDAGDAERGGSPSDDGTGEVSPAE